MWIKTDQLFQNVAGKKSSNSPEIPNWWELLSYSLFLRQLLQAL